MRKGKTYTSRCGEQVLRGIPEALIGKYVALARDARSDKDRVQEQVFLQQAEHYERIK